MSLKERIQEDLKAAMRAHDKSRVETLRMLSSALKDAEIRRGGLLEEAAQVEVVTKQIKQRQDAAKQYRQGGREELASQEEAEIRVLEEYLPPPVDEEELETIIEEAIQGSGAQGLQDIGSVMQVLKERLQGRVDLGQVSQRVKSRLAP